MSRIHEALKKAAQERHAQMAERSNGVAVDLSSEGLAHAVVPESLPLDARTDAVSGRDRGVFRFEEFIKKCQHPAWHLHPGASVFATDRTDHVGAEKFRTLRSRLYQIQATRPLRKLLVTSSLPEEGKTFTVANLAQSIVRQPERRVLLIDADLRSSRLHRMFGAPEKPGLTDYLRGDADEFAVMQVGPQGNLCLIPGGEDVTNPSELLHSERMRQFLDKMAQVFDWVILDSPPALAVHDASILADMCDGVMFVVRAGSTDFQLAEKASLEFREKNLLGVVLNRVDRHEGYGTYYYGYSPEKPAPGKTVAP
jgi:protein-tyrosine kinase